MKNNDNPTETDIAKSDGIGDPNCLTCEGWGIIYDDDSFWYTDGEYLCHCISNKQDTDDS